MIFITIISMNSIANYFICKSISTKILDEYLIDKNQRYMKLHNIHSDIYKIIKMIYNHNEISSIVIENRIDITILRDAIINVYTINQYIDMIMDILYMKRQNNNGFKEKIIKFINKKINKKKINVERSSSLEYHSDDIKYEHLSKHIEKIIIDEIIKNKVRNNQNDYDIYNDGI